MKRPELPELAAPAAHGGGGIEAEMRRRSRRGFLVALAAAAAAAGSWRWLLTRAPESGAPWPVRRMLRFNEAVTSRLFDPARRLPEVAAADLPPDPRLNGDVGLTSALDPDAWRLRVAGTAVALSLAELQTLPHISQRTELNCVEGWTTAAKWTGVRFADFVRRFAPGMDRYPYVGLRTPDDQYYVGLDTPSAMHAQTLLCFAINDAPLTPEHGAPLRLLIPTKYGYKNLKRIGAVSFSDQRPPDYWAEQGYDWFAGL